MARRATVSSAVFAALALTAGAATLEEEARHYRIVTIAAPEAVRESRDTGWKPPPGGPVLEVSGIALPTDPQAPAPLAVATRKGEIWLLDGAGDDPPDR
ncbi:MAG: hypothetical protein ACOYK7_12140, partial [Pirellulales bacterium]